MSKIIASGCKFLPLRTVADAKAIRNESWLNSGTIPSWINPEDVDLDCFYTQPDIAQECSDNLYAFMQNDGI